MEEPRKPESPVPLSRAGERADVSAANGGVRGGPKPSGSWIDGPEAIAPILDRVLAEIAAKRKRKKVARQP